VAEQSASLDIAAHRQVAGQAGGQIGTEISGAGSHEQTIHVGGLQAGSAQAVGGRLTGQMQRAFAVTTMEFVGRFVGREVFRVEPEVAPVDPGVEKNFANARTGVAGQFERLLLREAARGDTGRTGKQNDVLRGTHSASFYAH
jgi:hypothetical protein